MTLKHDTYSVNVCCILGPPEKPKNVALLAKSHNSLIVSWEAGLNGGSEQHFKVHYREKGQKIYQESLDSIIGLETGQSMNYTLKGLHSKKEYEIIVVAINLFEGRSETEAPVLTVKIEGRLWNKVTEVEIAKSVLLT